MPTFTPTKPSSYSLIFSVALDNSEHIIRQQCPFLNPDNEWFLVDAAQGRFVDRFLIINLNSNALNLVKVQKENVKPKKERRMW